MFINGVKLEFPFIYVIRDGYVRICEAAALPDKLFSVATS